MNINSSSDSGSKTKMFLPKRKLNIWDIMSKAAEECVDCSGQEEAKAKAEQAKVCECAQKLKEDNFPSENFSTERTKSNVWDILTKAAREYDCDCAIYYTQSNEKKNTNKNKCDII